MFKRILSALVMAPLLIGAILFPAAWLFQALVIICLSAALYEYLTVQWGKSASGERVLGALLGAGFGLWSVVRIDLALGALLPLVALLLFAFLYFLLRKNPEQAAAELAHIVFGTVYVVGFGIHIAWLRALPDGVFWVFAVLAATWLNDTFAYFVGHLWGRHRLALHLSPGKTWEGWFGGIAGSAVGLYFFWWLLPNPLSWVQVACLVGIASVFGPMGDLAESLLKRAAGVKDSGHMIPGHGGLLDRIDALLFNGPLFYYFAVWWAS